MEQAEANRPLVVFVEGIISAGKSHLLKLLSEFPDLHVIDEPVSVWRDYKGSNILNLMYKDPSKWSLTLQSLVQLSLLKNYLLPVTTESAEPIAKIMARSVFSAKYCFIQVLKERKLLTIEACNLLDDWLEFLIEKFKVKVDVIIYVRTDPEIAYERLKKRGRPEEAGIGLVYLKQLHEQHDKWLRNASGEIDHTDKNIIEMCGDGTREDFRELAHILHQMLLKQYKKEEQKKDEFFLFLGADPSSSV